MKSGPKDQAIVSGPAAATPGGAADAAAGDEAAKRKEITLRLFGCFLKAVETSPAFAWPRFRRELETVLWEGALMMSGGSRREAAGLIGVPYEEFVDKLPDEPCEEKDNGSIAVKKLSQRP